MPQWVVLTLFFGTAFIVLAIAAILMILRDMRLEEALRQRLETEVRENAMNQPPMDDVDPTTPMIINIKRPRTYAPNIPPTEDNYGA